MGDKIIYSRKFSEVDNNVILWIFQLKEEDEMENLAGKQECNRNIKRELTRCGIEIVRNQPREGEVSSSLRGKLGNFTFSRSWSYWVVSGDVPLAVAKELYADPVGKTDIRVGGHCGCPPPEGLYVKWLDKDGKLLYTTEEQKKCERYAKCGGALAEVANRVLSDPKNRFVDDPGAVGAGFLTGYHIDSEIGLRLFADTLKKHKVV